MYVFLKFYILNPIFCHSWATELIPIMRRGNNEGRYTSTQTLARTLVTDRCVGDSRCLDHTC